jgi:chlorobactene glucosyltransferase
VAPAALTHLCALASLAYAASVARNAEGLERVPIVRDPPPLPSLSVVVPARNEERSIERCVVSLLAQTIDVELIVVDDRSEDATPAILAALAARDPRLQIVRGAPLPDGWVGKPWALAQGAKVARGEWLLFTDADSAHEPYACVSALGFARTRDVDALTIWTRQELGSWGERAALPTILGLVLLASGTIAQLNDPYDPEHALANGQYVLVSRRAYDALGGHEALRDELVEDVAFAHRLKEDGRYRLLIANGEALVRVRMYRSLAEIWDGFTKNVYAGAGGDLVAIAGSAAFLALLSAVPTALAIEGVARRRRLRAAEAMLSLGVTIAAQAYAFGRIGLPRRLAGWAPFGFAFAAAVALNSTARVLGGRGVSWRGRVYSGRVGGRRP